MTLQDVKPLFSGSHVVWMATADASGMPNVAPMRQLWWSGERTLVIGDLFMKVSAANVQATGRACLGVHDAEGEKAWKLTGTASYETEGPNYDLAQTELAKKKPDKRFKGVVVFTVQAVYDQMPGPNAGKVVFSY
ncbi:MAG: pyridoxamine 5'-phosphate oxidase family protein [Pirellulales bacterium]|nr:pyridoxamine 5'-phosphate oxidase family protein [Pirellulales bacterium]